MNKKLYLLILLCFLTMQVVANPISKSEARAIAQEFIGVNDSSDDNVPIAPYYVFSRGEGKGYVIVSGDDTTAPIIGYTEQGDYDVNTLPLPLKLMLDNWANKISQIQNILNRQKKISFFL